MVDFGALWEQESHKRRPAADAGEWDARARQDASKFGPSAYSQAFLDLAGLLPGESVFDMGCGAGSLAIPCALEGRHVLAADFSPVMLQRCRDGLPDQAPGTLETSLLAWDDDWRAAGVQPRSFDVAFASRSIATTNLRAAVEKLSQVARRKVCVTVVAGKSPRVSQQLFDDLGFSQQAHQDAAFVFGVATQLGFEPDVRFLHSNRIDRFCSRDEAEQAYLSMLDFTDPVLEGERLQQARQQVHAWLDEHLQHEASASRPYYVDAPRIFSWAFISWDV